VLLGLPAVRGVHDLHIWAMGTSEVALTAHLEVDGPAGDPTDLLCAAQQAMHDRFEIRHVTLQLEPPTYAGRCGLHADGCGQASPPASAAAGGPSDPHAHGHA
jgi:cobalt-zinc-cadmium efflux system protein